jgi:hypothetical protein
MSSYSKAGAAAACVVSLPSNTSPHTLTQLGPVVSVSPVLAVVKWWYCMFCLCRYIYHSKLNPGREVRKTTATNCLSVTSGCRRTGETRIPHIQVHLQ